LEQGHGLIHPRDDNEKFVLILKSIQQKGRVRLKLQHNIENKLAEIYNVLVAKEKSIFDSS
jgi:hypothetical protein